MTVVDTRDGSLSHGMSVVIDEGKIQTITERPVHVRGEARAIDASGKYLVPGFLDMHVHCVELGDKDPHMWPLFIANGITGVREMSGSDALILRVKELNADSAAGLVDVPEILMVHAGTLGPPFTDAAARAFVQAKKAAGADFIKILPGSPASVFATLDEAEKVGLTVAGHLVLTVSARDSSKAGWHVIEHLGAGFSLMLDCSTDEANIRQDALVPGATFPTPIPLTPEFIADPRRYDGNQNAPFLQRILDTYDKEKCEELARVFVENDTWQVPTLIRLGAMEIADSPRYSADPALIYVDSAERAGMEKLAQEFHTFLSDEARETLRKFHRLERKVTKLLKRNGVKMLAGSDSPYGGIWMIPGFSLHREFRELAASGLSPLEILQMTTLNGAEFLGREDTMGTVDEGKNADLVLLDANPVKDVANLDKIAAVFLKGKYFSRHALHKMKRDAALAYNTVED